MSDKYKILNTINSPKDLKNISKDKLSILSDEISDYINQNYNNLNQKLYFGSCFWLYGDICSTATTNTKTIIKC